MQIFGGNFYYEKTRTKKNNNETKNKMKTEEDGANDRAKQKK